MSGNCNGKSCRNGLEIEELKSPGKIAPELITGADKLIIIDACRGEDGQGGFAKRYYWGDEELKNIFSRTIHCSSSFSVV